MAFRSEPCGRVLVTGLNGFTGYHLVSALESAGYSVCASEPDGRPDFNLTDQPTIERMLDRVRPESVIHLAGISFVAYGKASDFYSVNTVGTTNLIEALHRSALPLRRVILASSANVYGNAIAETISEVTSPSPVNDYACSKLAMEFLARTWFDRLPIVITRPFNYTGPGQALHFVVPKIVDHFARRVPQIELGNLDVIRDFSDVRSIADVYCRLLTSPTRGEIYNICSGNGLTLQWIIDRLAEISGHSLHIEVNQDFVRTTEVKRLIGSNDKLLEAIGPMKYVDFSETLRWMYESRCQELRQATTQKSHV